MREKYCSICGTEVTTIRTENRTRNYCPKCDRIQYRNPKPCAGVCVVDGTNLLLIKRTTPPDVGAWSLPAGYLEVDEPPKQAAIRELFEETSVQTDPDAVNFYDSVMREHPDGQHILVLIYTVPRSDTSGTPQPGSDAAAARFWNVDALIENEDIHIETGYQEIYREVVESVHSS